MNFSREDRELMAKHFDKDSLGHGSYPRGEAGLGKLKEDHPVGNSVAYRKDALGAEKGYGKITGHGTSKLGHHHIVVDGNKNVFPESIVRSRK